MERIAQTRRLFRSRRPCYKVVPQAMCEVGHRQPTCSSLKNYWKGKRERSTLKKDHLQCYQQLDHREYHNS